MRELTPERNRNVFYTGDDGLVKVKNIVMFVVVTPALGIMFPTARSKMKDACIACEDALDLDWDDLHKKGFRVMKLFAGGYDRTDQSIVSIDNWTEEEPDFATEKAKSPASADHTGNQ